MAIINAHKTFSNAQKMSTPVAKVPTSVKQSFNVVKAFENGTFKIEPKIENAIYDRTLSFDDINYINKDEEDKLKLITQMATWLNSMNTPFKLTFANTYQQKDSFLSEIRSEVNADKYSVATKGIHQWEEKVIDDHGNNIRKERYITIQARANSEDQANIYLNAIETGIERSFNSWKCNTKRLNAKERINLLNRLINPIKQVNPDFISYPQKGKRTKDFKNDILPKEIIQENNHMILDGMYCCVMYGHSYKNSLDADTFISSLTSLTYPSYLTLDLQPIPQKIINDKLIATQSSTERNISNEKSSKMKSGQVAIEGSYMREKQKSEVINIREQVDANSEQGFFLNLLYCVYASTYEELEERTLEVCTIANEQGFDLESCNYAQLQAWNTALPIGGRTVDYRRFFLSSSLVAMNPYYSSDVIEPGGYMLGLNKSTNNFIIGNRKTLPNPHAIIVGHTGYGKSFFMKETEITQTLICTNDDICIIDPQNEFGDVVKVNDGVFFDLAPLSDIALNGFEIPADIFNADSRSRRTFISKQSGYAENLIDSIMINMDFTSVHRTFVSQAVTKMYANAFEQKKLKRQPTLTRLREILEEEILRRSEESDRRILHDMCTSLEPFTQGSYNIIGRETTIDMNVDNRLIAFGLENIPEDFWEPIMCTIIHFLDIRMSYNQAAKIATHLIIDEAQFVSHREGSAQQLSDIVATYRKCGGIVTLSMQNVTAAVSNENLLELFQNCSYKVFFDQKGQDANEILKVQELSTLEFNDITSGKVGEGIICWNDKVLRFNAKLDKDNALYSLISTNFHEQAKDGSLDIFDGID